MFSTTFSHYLSYGASDQHTVRELRGSYDGLLLPGTVAAFQKEGTGGFVLTLSASAGIPYVIDPRFPLFQQTIASPKKSHLSLAEILGLPETRKPKPEWFTEKRIDRIGEKWAKFNCSYQGLVGGKFSKYAKRLGDDSISPDHATNPAAVIAPYFVSDSTEDPWWDLSSKLYDATAKHVNGISPDTPCVRVVSTERADALDEMLKDGGNHVAVWISGLNEIKAAPSEDGSRLLEYGKAIRLASGRGQRVFALYGGFFSVLLGNFGLAGSSHGVGYGEARAWRELPRSGPPPARYYQPELHRFISPELAFELWRTGVSRCDCAACGDDPPVLLEYHSLMMHSVHCRSREVAAWSALGPDAAAKRLAAELKSFRKKLGNSELPDLVKQDVLSSSTHIPHWVEIVREIAAG